MPTIRLAREADLPALASTLAPLPLFTAYALTAEALAQRWATGLRSGDGVWLAEDGGTSLGMCWFLSRGTFATGAYLRTLAVVPGAQNQGLGAQLLQTYERESGQPSGGWFLLASDFNDGAHRFYQRHGYQDVGRLPGFASATVTERIFWKPRPR